MEQLFGGNSASPGIAIGESYLFITKEVVCPSHLIPPEHREEEKRRFYKGREETKDQLELLQKKTATTLGKAEAEVFEGHIEILQDQELERAILSDITKGLPAERAAKETFQREADEFSKIDSPYMRERAEDIKDIGRRLQHTIAKTPLLSLEELPEGVIIFADNLTPSESALMDKERVRGFITRTGGLTSHVALMAKSLGIPAIVGASQIPLSSLEEKVPVILDANQGKVFYNPSQENLKEYKAYQEQEQRERKALQRLKDKPAVTLDGRQVEVCANIGHPKELSSVLEQGADGIGLFRSEFLFMDSETMPSEVQQFKAYKTILEGMEGKAVIIRTMDIGGDKDIPYLDIPKEDNPFLGWRAIRMCLDRPELLETQLSALLRASIFGKLRILIPMISSVEEVVQVKALLDNVKDKLEGQKVSFDDSVELGVMIETPGAALIAERLIEHVDFFSIGTNDLTQYTLAVDRGNERISHLFRPFHPGVLLLIQRVIQASHQAGKWTGLCGEMAGDERATLLLLGLGLDEFSMSPPSVARVKNLIRQGNFEDSQVLARKVLALSSASDIIKALGK